MAVNAACFFKFNVPRLKKGCDNPVKRMENKKYRSSYINGNMWNNGIKH